FKRDDGRIRWLAEHLSDGGYVVLPGGFLFALVNGEWVESIQCRNPEAQIFCNDFGIVPALIAVGRELICPLSENAICSAEAYVIGCAAPTLACYAKVKASDVPGQR
ncbi:hypothetical protein FOZ63_005334, partial [Perkinsus olseni]